MGKILDNILEKNGTQNNEDKFKKVKRKMLWKKETEELVKELLEKNNKKLKPSSVMALNKDYGEEKSFLFDSFDKISDFLFIAKEFIKKHPLYYDSSKMWWAWNPLKFRWILVDETDIYNAIDRRTKNPTVNSKIKAEILEALKRTSRLNKPKTPKDSWIQFKEKIIDIQTKEEFTASPEYFMANPINWELGECEETPIFDELFKSWVGEEHYIELYEILAFCMIPSYFIHRLFCLIGSGSNGKSTFLNVLIKFLGEESVVSSSLYMLLKGRFEGSKLLKKLVCLMGETSFKLITDTDFLKKLTGEDLIRAEFKGKPTFDFKNYAKLIIATNSLPPTADKTVGFYRRWKIIEFPNSFNEESDIIGNIPNSEYKNLALKCLNIAKKIWEIRKFTNDGNFEARAKIYEEKSNPLMKFVKENYIKDINEEILFSEFYDSLISFLEERGQRLLSAIVVSKQLKNEGFDIKNLSKKGKNARFIIGLKSKDKGKVTHITHITQLLPHTPIGNCEKKRVI